MPPKLTTQPSPCRFGKQVVIASHVLGPCIRLQVASGSQQAAASILAKKLGTHGCIPAGVAVPTAILKAVTAMCKDVVPEHMPGIGESDAVSTPEDLHECVVFLRTACVEQLGRAVAAPPLGCAAPSTTTGRCVNPQVSP